MVKRRDFIRKGLLFLPLTYVSGLPAKSQVVPVRRVPRIPPAGGVDTFFHETFEPTGYDNTWTESSAGPWDPDETTTVKVGSKSLFATTSANRSNYTSFSDKTSIYGKFWFRVTSTHTGQPRYSVRDSSGTMLAEIFLLTATLKFRVFFGANNSTGSTVISVDTWYRLWFEFQESTGSDGTIKLWLATTDTKPGSTEVTRIDGTQSGQGGRFQIFGAASADWYTDDIQLSDDSDFE